LKLAQGLAWIFDPRMSGSISQIAMSSDGLKFFHKVPFEMILSVSEINLIESKDFDSLPTILHNLSAEATA
jgi:hypothetical protein